MGLFMASSFLVSSVPKEKKTPLAGVALFPNERYEDWLRMQLNPAFGNKEKILSTINAFFILKYESWLKEALLYFGFLFDQDDAEALEDYAYERGLLYLSLEGWRYNNTLLERYQYEPNFYKVLIGKSKATVEMRPYANLVHRHTQGRISSSPWTEHKISLILKGDRWLIKRIICDDPAHNIYPHGSDFEKIAATLPDRNRDELAKHECELKSELIEVFSNRIED
jgi:hypothetical protein